MSRLNAQEQLFVLCLFEKNGDATAALHAAGVPAKNQNTAWRMAHYRMHRKDIQEAIVEHSKTRTVAMAPKVQAAVEALIDNPSHQDHFKALKMARDDAGVSRAVERVLNVNVTNTTDVEKLEAIKLFAISHGIDPQKFLGKPTVEAEFTEFTDEDRELGIV